MDREVVTPLVNHAERIANLERDIRDHERGHGDSLDSLRQDLTQMVNNTTGTVSEKLSALLARVDALEAKLEATATSLPVVKEVVPEAEHIADEAVADTSHGVDIVEAPVERTLVPPEKSRGSARSRRKARRKK